LDGNVLSAVRMISESLNGITPEEMRVFWKVAHHITKNLAGMAEDDVVLD
jgi:MarR family transcriptional regulator, organic hydroperoxide resistance regulator